jgi:hypothetical protein
MDGAKGFRILNEAGALAAGVLELCDWTEVRDFCNRAAQRVASAGDAPVPSARRERLKDEQLPSYFVAWRDTLQEKGAFFDVDELIARLPPIDSTVQA